MKKKNCISELSEEKMKFCIQKTTMKCSCQRLQSELFYMAFMSIYAIELFESRARKLKIHF